MITQSIKSRLVFILIIAMINLYFFSAGIFAQKRKIPESGEIELSSPVRISFTNKNFLIVSDYNLEMIIKVKIKENKIIGGFPVDGKPLGLAFAQGFIYVGNETNGCVDVYTLNGKYMRSIGGNHSIRKPNDIAVDTKTKQVFVVDTIDKAVKIYTFKGKLKGTISASYPDFNMLSNPTAITVDPVNKEIYVSDYGDVNLGIKAKVQIFDYSGNLIKTISGTSKSGMMGTTYRFSRPQGLAVDQSGHVFVVDSYSGQVYVYDRISTTYLFSIGTYGTEPGQLKLPLDIAIDDPTKDIYIVNSQMKRIEVFRGESIW